MKLCIICLQYQLFSLANRESDLMEIGIAHCCYTSQLSKRHIVPGDLCLVINSDHDNNLSDRRRYNVSGQLVTHQQDSFRGLI